MASLIKIVIFIIIRKIKEFLKLYWNLEIKNKDEENDWIMKQMIIELQFLILQLFIIGMNLIKFISIDNQQINHEFEEIEIKIVIIIIHIINFLKKINKGF